ncbi:unnamed protein product, partial [Meganyctiphanes norvegica]
THTTPLTTSPQPNSPAEGRSLQDESFPRASLNVVNGDIQNHEVIAKQDSISDAKETSNSSEKSNGHISSYSSGQDNELVFGCTSYSLQKINIHSSNSAKKSMEQGNKIQ